MPDVQSIKKQLHMQQWTAIIEDRIASGLKIDEYCEKNQLSRNSYFYWLRKIREEMSTSVLPDHNDLLPASVSTKALVELVPGSAIMIPSPKSRSQMKKRKVLAFPLTESALLLVTIYRKNCFPKS